MFIKNNFIYFYYKIIQKKKRLHIYFLIRSVQNKKNFNNHFFYHKKIINYIIL